ncbi:N-acetylmuramoyl-L-alanine amidase [Micrococcales bacterium 31B]|nr:N-acetylmuramoyl-L-alanine amidase [Micrococcales bacterium 31B]
MSQKRTLTRRQAHGVILTAALGTAGVATAIANAAKSAAVASGTQSSATLAAASGGSGASARPKTTTSTKVRLASAPAITGAQANTTETDDLDFAGTLAGNARVQLKEGQLTDPRIKTSLDQVRAVGARRVSVGESNLVAATWTGAKPDLVAMRSQNPDGSWSEWLPLANVAGPDTKPVNGTEPAWIGDAQAVDIRALRNGKDVTDSISLVTIHSPETADDGVVQATAASTQAAYDMPAVISRASWGCDESLRSWSPTYGSTNQLVALHHAEGTNSYTSSQAASQVRGIYYYHAVTLGWGDIGYNVVADKYGNLYEGRYGGLNRNPNGGHAYGFNSNTAGVCMLGSFTSISPSDAMIASITRWVGWKSGGYYHFDVNGTTSYAPTVSDKWPAGVYNNFKRFVGHRDLIYTSCPGDRAYPLLAGMRTNINAYAANMKTASYHAYVAAGGSNVLGFVYQIETQSGSTRTTLFSGGAKIVHTSGNKPIVYGENGAQISYTMPAGVNLNFGPSSGGGTGSVPPGVYFCKYSWSPDIYAVNFNGSTDESKWSWERLTYDKWVSVGSPKPSIAGWIKGTVLKKYGTGSEIFAILNGRYHKLTWDEWKAMGFRAYNNASNEGIVKVSWAPEVVQLTNLSGFSGKKLSSAQWDALGRPTPQVRSAMPGQYFEKSASSADVYWVVPGVGIRRKITYNEWRAAGSPAPRVV